MFEQAHQPTDRRPLASRERAIFKRMASVLTRHGVSPNAISTASIFFAGIAAAGLVTTGYWTGLPARFSWLVAAASVQLRLIMNMLDGMVAIESGKASPVGELYNEVPDRISDPLILVAAGYAAGSDPLLGWAAALLSLFVAYVRAIGKSAGAGQVFLGPMAKPQRMFLVTLGCLYCAFSPQSWQPTLTGVRWGPMSWVLLLIVIGCVVTSFRRLLRISQSLHEIP